MVAILHLLQLLPQVAVVVVVDMQVQVAPAVQVAAVPVRMIQVIHTNKVVLREDRVLVVKVTLVVMPAGGEEVNHLVVVVVVLVDPAVMEPAHRPVVEMVLEVQEVQE
jgi:hypothetical protein